jgi:prepilin peptidase CpaA
MSLQVSYDLIPLAALAALLIAAAVGDIRRYQIPNWISIAVAALYPLYVLLHPQPVDWGAALIVALGLFGLGFALHWLGAMGGGDVKLLAAAGLWAGTQYLMPLILIMALSGGLLAAVLMLVRARRKRALPTGAKQSRSQMPYGVAIATGGVSVSALLAIG